VAKAPKVVIDDRFEEVGIQFLRVMGLEVDAALKAAGITDVKKRRKVVDTFCFGMGNFFDQYWFEAEGERYFAVVCFADKHLQDGPKTLGLPENFDYHDYALGGFDLLTNKGKGPYDVRVGLVGDDEPMNPEELED
jgi:hypothetical protein